MSNKSLIYLLDTNVCIMYLKGRSSNINRHFDTLEVNKIAVCSVVKAELFYGAMGSNNSHRRLGSGVMAKYLSLNEAKEAGELDWLAIGGTWGIATSRLLSWQAQVENLPVLRQNSLEPIIL